MHVIYEAFGHGANLYELLRVDRSVDGAGLRKAYYKTALVYHPDKQPPQNAASTTSNTTTTAAAAAAAALKFQAVTAAYQILQDAEKRQIYDETGSFGGLDDDDDDIDEGGGGTNNPWKDYFDRIFGRVTSDGIDQFAQSYKCSDEEKRHVLEQYENCHGNLVKMLDYVMLSTPRDAIRWVDDYLRPALLLASATGDTTTTNTFIDSKYTSTMEKTLKKVRMMVEKEEKKERELRQQDDEQQTESEEEEEEEEETNNKNGRKKKKPTTKPASTGNHGKKRKNAAAEKNDMSSLIAQIQNKNKRGGGNTTMADFAARYGVTMNDDDHDPLADDDAFRRAQAKVVQDKKQKNQATKTAAQLSQRQQSKRGNTKK